MNCWKVRYDTLREAKRAISGIKRRDADRSPGRFEAFACRQCGGFHLGHRGVARSVRAKGRR